MTAPLGTSDTHCRPCAPSLLSFPQLFILSFPPVACTMLSSSSANAARDKEPLLPVASSSSQHSDGSSSPHQPQMHRRNDSDSVDSNSYDSETNVFTSAHSKYRSRSPSVSPPPYKSSFNRHIASSLDALAGSRSGKARRIPRELARYRRKCSMLVVGLIAMVAILSTALFVVLSSDRLQVRLSEPDATAQTTTESQVEAVTSIPPVLPPVEDQSKAEEQHEPVREYSDYVVGAPTPSFRGV